MGDRDDPVMAHWLAGMPHMEVTAEILGGPFDGAQQKVRPGEIEVMLWEGTPHLALAAGLPHVEAKVGLPASGVYVRYLLDVEGDRLVLRRCRAR